MGGDWIIGVIGGSGLYELAGLQDGEALDIAIPWGSPSGPVTRGRIGRNHFLFLPRHGSGHRLSPTHINYRANIDALKRAGATDVLAISAVGSLREELAPGHFVAVDQFIDRTRQRPSSFFGDGVVAHVSLAEPVCPRLSGIATEAAARAGATVHRSATYLAMEGPQFSTRAESNLYRSWNCDVIGMTGMPEARLAREAELPYALMAMVTDYDCWREGEVVVADALAVLKNNAATAGKMLAELSDALPAERPPSPIDTVLDVAIVTPPEARDPALVGKLDAICRRTWRDDRG